MPLGLWKSKWEIHREDMARYREESDRRSAEHHEKMERYREESTRRSAEHHERMERYREESARRSAEHDEKMERYREDAEKHGEKMERFSEEMREERAAAQGRWLQMGEETQELREKYDRELAETRRFNREMLTRLEKTYAHLGTMLVMVGDELIAMRGEIHELKGAVDAQTNAIMKLLDRFQDPGGRPPV